ncbi:MAG: hypothetical protein JXR21_01965 [Candidatus Marinimicrobia bacterium]|nr:hypothetical protein [Candidatus Neomarinimicrobiota bacterium]
MKKTYFRGIAAGVVLLTLAGCDLFNGGSGTNTEYPGYDVVLDGNIRRNLTLHADDNILLAGQTFVDSGYTLTIEPGTVIESLPDDGEGLAPCLVIKRGAKIMAEGTAANPITFTSSLPADLKRRGSWGGLILLGKAPVNKSGGQAFVEGLVGVPYGGTNENDDSGILKYVRVWYGGRSIGQDNEINGITLAGVGNGTTVEYCEVAFNLDDGFEMFGGTVDLKYCSVLFVGDDAFDTDLGYQGRGQFLFAMMGSEDGNRAFEMDNDGSDMDKQPRSFPQFSNVTLIGSGDTSVVADNDQMIRMREGSGGDFRNMIIVDGKNSGIRITDAPTLALVTATPGSGSNYLYFSPNNIIYHCKGGQYHADYGLTAIDTSVAIGATGRENALAGSVTVLPAPEGPAFVDVDAVIADDFFETVTFKGAFGSENWLLGLSWLDEAGRF